MPAISFQRVTKTFGRAGAPGGVAGDGAPAAVNDVSFDVEEGKFVVLLGPSGCGKTTLMRMVNRLIEPTSGEIFVNGQEVRRINPTQLRRHIGYVIQQVGLFPHMTVAQNVAVVPNLLGWDKSRIAERTDDLLDLVDLPASDFRKRYPRQLSGGQQQRVGIARAMAADPALMLMDEPFGAIDAITRADLQNELLNIQRKVVKTVLFVTHDVEEALRLADKIVVMRTGRVVQYDTPFHILTNPADEFVHDLLGTDDVFRQLSLVTVESIMQPLDGTESNLTVGTKETVRTALSLLIAHGADEVTVLDENAERVGRLTLGRILAKGSHEAAAASPGA